MFVYLQIVMLREYGRINHSLNPIMQVVMSKGEFGAFLRSAEDAPPSVVEGKLRLLHDPRKSLLLRNLDNDFPTNSWSGFSYPLAVIMMVFRAKLSGLGLEYLNAIDVFLGKQSARPLFYSGFFSLFRGCFLAMEGDKAGGESKILDVLNAFLGEATDTVDIEATPRGVTPRRPSPAPGCALWCAPIVKHCAHLLPPDSVAVAKATDILTSAKSHEVSASIISRAMNWIRGIT